MNRGGWTVGGHTWFHILYSTNIWAASPTSLSTWVVESATWVWKAVWSQGCANPVSGQNDSQILKAMATCFCFFFLTRYQLWSNLLFIFYFHSIKLLWLLVQHPLLPPRLTKNARQVPMVCFSWRQHLSVPRACQLSHWAKITKSLWTLQCPQLNDRIGFRN